jgi:hypothetical protein
LIARVKVVRHMEREFDCGKVTLRGRCSTHGEADPDFRG